MSPERETNGIGVSCTATHWLRAVKAFGGPPRALFLIQTWWPLTDPEPERFGR